jgi:hypothetical protein
MPEENKKKSMYVYHICSNTTDLLFFSVCFRAHKVANVNRTLREINVELSQMFNFEFPIIIM